MRGWTVPRFGEAREVLELTALPDPVAGDGQRVVTVEAASVNFADILYCRGTYQDKPPLPFTPGVELCGEVVALGPGVTGLEAGQRVVGAAAMPNGSFGEVAIMDAAGAFPAPKEFDDAEASAFYISYQTGWFALHRRAHLAPGETLLVHAAAGGVGSAAVQLGQAAGARVIGVVGGEEKAAAARALGADVVIDRYTEDFVAVVKEVTEGHGADVIYDPVGGDAYDRSTKCVAFEGRILIIGFAGGRIQTPALSHALVKNYSILGLHWGLYGTKEPAALRDCHEQLLKLAADGVIKPLVSDRLGLADVADGLERLAAGRTIGRLTFQP